MLTDSASDYEPPDLYSSKKKAVAEMEKRFEETLDDFVRELTVDEVQAFRREFEENGKMFFNLSEEDEHETGTMKLMWARSCSVEKAYVN